MPYIHSLSPSLTHTHTFSRYSLHVILSFVTFCLLLRNYRVTNNSHPVCLLALEVRLYTISRYLDNKVGLHMQAIGSNFSQLQHFSCNLQQYLIR